MLAFSIIEIILSITGLTTGNISLCFEKSLFNFSALSKSILYAPDNTKEKCVPPVASSKTFTTFSFFTIDIPVVPPPMSTTAPLSRFNNLFAADG